MRSFSTVCVLVLGAQISVSAYAQTAEQTGVILQRLDRLEKQNHELLEEIRSLREQMAHPGAMATPTPAVPGPGGEAQPPGSEAQPLSERQEVSEHRIEELAQTKVESSQRFPIQLTGTALFNAYGNGAYGGVNAQYPVVAAANAGPRSIGGTFRQTTVGLLFHGPQTFLGGQVSGSLYMDLFAGSAQSLNHLMRLRVATIQLEWSHTTFAVGQDKPLVSRREPNSLAQVGVSPLTGAGNPWLWQPQARVEQRFTLSHTNTIKAEAGIFQTAEAANQTADIAARVEAARPSFETRIAFRHEFSGERYLEFAPVFHTSTSHLAGSSIPSRLFGIDWLLKPAAKFEVTGLLFRGQNFANLGALGGLTIDTQNRVIAVHGKGGWLQVRYLTTQKLSFNVYAGQQDDRNRDLSAGRIAKNQYYAANAMYQLAPNVLSSFEFGRVYTTYLGLGNRTNNHYDLALAYQF